MYVFTVYHLYFLVDGSIQICSLYLGTRGCIIYYVLVMIFVSICLHFSRMLCYVSVDTDDADVS